MIRHPRQPFGSLDINTPTPTPVRRPEYAPDGSQIVAKFHTKNKRGAVDTIYITPAAPATVGRDPKQCAYVITDILVSQTHCKFSAVESGTGGFIISCTDKSMNGLNWNDQKVCKAPIILCHGDTVGIPGSQVFHCEVLVDEPQQKEHLFQGSQVQKNIGHFVVTNHCLGSGSFGSVYLAFDPRGYQQVACKSIRIGKNKKDRSRDDAILKEVEILSSLRHAGINRIVDYFKDRREGFLHIMLEVACAGDLYAYITTYHPHRKHNYRLCPGEAKYITFQLLQAVKYLHQRFVAHRDLKPENILLYTPGPYPRVQLGDFGLARTQAFERTLNVQGTISYLPPEGIFALKYKEAGYTSMPSDCWSLGVIIFLMLTGSHPFDRADTAEICQCHNPQYPSSQCLIHKEPAMTPETRAEMCVKAHILRYEVVFNKRFWSRLPDAHILVANLLEYDGKKRMTVYGALEADWILQDINKLINGYIQRVGPLS